MCVVGGGGRGGGIHEKPIYRWGLPKNRAWTVCRFEGGLGKKEGRGGDDTPMHTMHNKFKSCQ